jgi:sugar phosphate isomerase/epimerase
LNPEYLGSFREALAKANVKVVDIAVDGPSSFYDKDPGTRQKSVMYAKSWVDVAVAIGSPSIRTHISRATNSSPDAQRAADSLRRVAEYGAVRNVVINL